MKTNENDSCKDESPLILLSGDNNRTTSILHRSLVEGGFYVEVAPTYDHLPVMWLERRHTVVLLEVSGAHSVEGAVNAALQLKRLDHLLFVAYLAEPALHTSGLAGDAILSRDPEELAEALRILFGRTLEPQ